jgi:hypothetical protein
MSSKWVQNQQNPPGKKRVDSQGNIRKKFIVRREGASIIIAEGCTKEAYACAWTRFSNDIIAAGGKVLAEGKPIQ